MHRKLALTCEKLTQTCERLVNSQEEYTAIEKKLEQVQEGLLATQVQLNKCFTLSTSHKIEKVLEGACAQRVKLLDELQAANKEITILQKQLACGVSSVMANPMASYRPRGIGPKN